MAQTFVLGGVQSDFARNLSRDKRELSDLVGELIDGALADAALDATDIETIHVGNAFGELFAGQGHLGAMPATVRESLWGVPAMRHEAACASGSIAILAAMAELEAGRYEVALVLGAEQERNVSGEQAAKFLGAAAWAGHEGNDARYLWPSMFSQIGDAYDERWGLDRKHLAAISRKNLTNAKRNPHAQTRGWTLTDAMFAEDDEHNPVVEGRPRTVGLPLATKLARSDRGGLLMPHVSHAADAARRRAGIALKEVHGIEAHDCFSTTEYLAIDHIGLTAPGESWKAIEDGSTAMGGRLPINPSGGLIGGGHPVGATGIRMALDATLQVTGRAGDYQVDNAKRFATLNLGGSAATVVSLILATR